MFPLILTLALSAAITVEPRAPFAVGVISPSGAPTRVRLSSLVDAISDSLQKHTDLSASVFDAAVIRECKGDAACVIARVDPTAPYAMIVSVLSEQGAPDRLSVVILDAARARTLPPERTDEAVLIERVQQATREEEAAAFLHALIEGDLRAHLEEAKHWQVYGELRLRSSAAGAELFIDGLSVGTVVSAETVIRDLRRGAHRVALELGQEQRLERDVTIGAEPALLELDPLALAPVRSDTARYAIAGTGAALAAAGIAVAIYASTRGATGACLSSAALPACEESSSAARTGFDPSATSFEGDPNRGVPLVSIAGALLAAGATWTIGALLIEDDAEIPLFTILAGAALGGGAFAAGYAF